MKFKESAKLKIDGEKVIVRELSARQRGELFQLNNAETNPVEIQAHIVKMGCPKYKDTSIDDISDFPGTSVDEISKEILDISGLGDDAEAEAEKNS